MRMRAALDRFDDTSAERELVGPNWNVRDLVGHFIHWDTEAAARMPEIASGRPTPSYDFVRVNEEVFRKYRRMSYVMLLPQLRAAEEKLLTTLRGVKPELLIDSPVRTWIDEAAIEHYDHHWPGLQSAMRRVCG